MGHGLLSDQRSGGRFPDFHCARFRYREPPPRGAPRSSRADHDFPARTISAENRRSVRRGPARDGSRHSRNSWRLPAPVCATLCRAVQSRHRSPAPEAAACRQGVQPNVQIQTSRHVTLRQLARAQPKGLNFRVFLREKCTCCELLSFSKLLELNDWQNAVTSCPTVPNDLLERERFYCKHRCSRASTSGKLSEVLMSEIDPAFAVCCRCIAPGWTVPC